MCAQLAFAPAVPPPCSHKHPVHMIAELESVTRTLHISPLHKYRAWTFNGTVRGWLRQLPWCHPPQCLLLAMPAHGHWACWACWAWR